MNEHEIAFMVKIAEDVTDIYTDGELSFERMKELSIIVLDDMINVARQEAERD